MDILRLIHLSDLHFVPGNADQERLLAALISDIQIQVRNRGTPHLIVLSGDITHRGSYPKDFKEDLSKAFLRPLRDVVGSEAFIVPCPGNHDVNLRRRNELLAPVFDEIRDSSRSAQLVRQGLSTGGLFDHLTEYWDLEARIEPRLSRNGGLHRTATIDVGSRKVGVVAVNSAWRTLGGGLADYGHILVGEPQLEHGLDEINSSDLKILVLHHPHNWIAPFEGGYIMNAAMRGFDAMLCGHNHIPNGAKTANAVDALFVSSAGCLYENREYFNGYTVLEFDFNTRAWTLEGREYYSQRNAFDIAPRVGPEGVATFEMPRRDAGNITIIPPACIAAARARADAMLLTATASDVAPKTLGAIFVEPLLSKKSQYQGVTDELDAEDEGWVKLSDSLAQEHVLLIYGVKEAGKTTLLNNVATLRVGDSGPTYRLGAVVDLSALKRVTLSEILNAAIQYCGNELSISELRRLAESGQFVFCLDNFDANYTKQVDCIAALMGAYPGCRFVLSALEIPAAEILETSKLKASLPVTVLYLHPLRRPQVRELVARWFGEEPAQVKDRLDVVMGLLGRLGVPKTPFVVSVLIWVLEKKPTTSPINRAAAIDALIDGLLEKLIEVKSLGSVDSTVKKHFLSDLAVHLDSLEAESISVICFESFVVDYFRRKNEWKVSAHAFADELFAKGILFNTGVTVGFKFGCFRAFFLAQRLGAPGDLRDKALSARSVFNYVEEIELYTGLSRADGELLNALLGTTAALFAAVDFTLPLENFEKIGLPASALGVLELERLETKYLNNPKHVEERENMLDGVDDSVEPVEDTSRKIEPSSPVIKAMGALRATSNALRNSELLEDRALQERAFNECLRYWAQSTLATTSALDSAAFLDHLRETLSTKFPAKASKEEIEATLKIVVPQFMGAVMEECFASSKLRPQIICAASEAAALPRLLSIFLALTAGIDEAVSLIQRFVNDYHGNKYLVQVVFFRALRQYFMSAPAAAGSIQLRALLGDIFIVLKSHGSREQDNRVKTNFLQQMDLKFGQAQDRSIKARLH